MNKKTNVTFILIGAVGVLVVLTLLKLGSFNRTQGITGTVSTPRDQRMQVRMQVVHPEKLGDKAITIGTILSNEEVEVRSETSGKIEKIHFREGGRVKVGEILLKINDAELQAQMLRARYRQVLAEQQEQRQLRLLEEKLTSREEYDNSVANLNIVKADVQLIKAQIDKTEIRAPFDGTIGLRYTSEGSYITPTTLITRLQDNGNVKIDFAIPEKYAGSIKHGDKITFTVQGTSRTFAGTIYAIEPKIDPTTRTLRMRAVMPNRDGAILPGTFATVDVSFREREAIMIPSYALIPELKGYKVFLYKDGKAESRSVETGIRTDELVEVTQGLQAGDTLITSGILQLRPGMAVRPAQDQPAGPPSGAKESAR